MSLICENCKMLTEPMGVNCEFCGKDIRGKTPDSNIELKEKLKSLYNESRQMAMLRVDSPIDHMVDGALALIEQAKYDVLNKLWISYINKQPASALSLVVELSEEIDQLSNYKKENTDE